MNVRDMGNIYSMLHFCDAIERKMGRFGIDEGTWFDDPDMRDVIYVSIEQIGERASKVSNEGRSELPDVQWQEIVGLRNVVIHSYDNISVESVWGTISEDVPKLKEELLAHEDVRRFYEQQRSQISADEPNDPFVRLRSYPALCQTRNVATPGNTESLEDQRSRVGDKCENPPDHDSHSIDQSER